ncbi:MAG: hypothetical protein FJ279_07725, partial [Planctomycetes bacterium]|nr:hypothetical protein [Planctomycetota bacterium]
MATPTQRRAIVRSSGQEGRNLVSGRNQVSCLCVAVVLLVSAAVAKAQPHLLFHAPFDGHAKAICAGGEMAGEAATGLAYAPGKVSQAWQARAGATCTFPSAGLFTGDEGTFECWVQPAWDSNDGQKHYLLADDSRFVKIYKHSDGRLYVQVRLLGEPDTWISAGGRIDWKAGQWHHVVVAWSGVTDRDTPATAAIHVDGVLVAWHQAKGALAPLGKRLWIGSDAKGGDSFEGLIDEVKLHAKALVSLERPTAVATKSAGAAPMDDPYLSDTLALPRDVPADPLHHLDTVQATPWGLLSRDVAREVFGDSAEERVIFRDSVTGAEVWLLTRLAGEEGIAYTNYYPYNADGSLVRIWGRRGLIMRPDGRLVAAFADLIPHEFVGLPQWSKTDPNVVVCQTAKGGLFEFNLKTKERRVIYMPDDSIPDGTVIQFSDDRQHSMFITKQGRRGEQWMWLGDGNGQNLRKVQMKSRSPKPEQDKMGSASFIRDQHGQLYARYSLNKGSNDPNTPYQNWLVTLDGASFREMDSHNNLKDGTPLRFIPAGTFIVTGHGGYSPSGKHFVHHKEKPGYKWIRDLATWTQRDIARIPGCDHMDWTVDDNWFFVWAMQVGLPIYKTYVDTGVVHRIVCTNSCPHTYGSCPYHGSSPDGTKLVYQSSMLGNNDVYQAIVKHPEPPVQVALRREGQAVVLTWQPPRQHKEVRGHNVFRAARSASGYVRLNRDLVTTPTFTDPAPPKSAYYAITSVEHSGLESRVFSTEVATDWSHGASIYIEAEDGKLTPP